ncbi:hypothetical protein QW180_20915 [Vibrio sinaloensis]|nr:hypothetical protein [Vibrio sinaloensis]
MPYEKKFLSIVALSVATITAMPTIAAAPTQSNSKGAVEQTNPTIQRIQELRQQLAGIRSKAFETNPDLVEAANKANEALEIEAKSVGYDPKGFEQALQKKAQTELTKEGVTEKKQRQAIVAELQKKQDEQKKRKATSIYQSLTLRKSTMTYRKKVVAAMKKKTDPKKTQAVMDELETLVKSLKS